MRELNLAHSFFDMLDKVDQDKQDVLIAEIFEHFQKEGEFTEAEAREGIECFINNGTPSDKILAKFADLVSEDKFHLCDDEENGMRVDYTQRSEEELTAIEDYDSPFDALEGAIGSYNDFLLGADYVNQMLNSSPETDTEDESIATSVMRRIADAIGSTPEKVRYITLLKGYDDNKIFEISKSTIIEQELALDPVITNAEQFFNGVYGVLAPAEQIYVICDVMDRMVDCGAWTKEECEAGIDEVCKTYGAGLENYKPDENPNISEMVHKFNTGKLELFAKIEFDANDKVYFNIRIDNGDKFAIFFDNLTHTDRATQLHSMSIIFEKMINESIFTSDEAEEALYTFSEGQPLRRELIDKFANLVRTGYVELREEKINGKRTYILKFDTDKYDHTKGFFSDVENLSDEDKFARMQIALERIANNLDMTLEQVYTLAKLKGYPTEQIIMISETNIGTQYMAFLPFFMNFKQFIYGIGNTLDKDTQAQIITNIIERLYSEDVFNEEQYKLALIDIENMFGVDGLGVNGDYRMLVKMLHKFVTGQAKLSSRVLFEKGKFLRGKTEITCRDAFDVFMESLDAMSHKDQITCIKQIFNKMFDDGLVTEAEKVEGIDSFVEHRQMDDDLAMKFLELVKNDYVSLYKPEDGRGVTLSFAKWW